MLHQEKNCPDEPQRSRTGKIALETEDNQIIRGCSGGPVARQEMDGDVRLDRSNFSSQFVASISMLGVDEPGNLNGIGAPE